MDDDLIRKSAPPRNKRYAGARDLDDEAQWASSLDWKDNPYDFHRLLRSIMARLDQRYRQGRGIRIDQLASQEELLSMAQSIADRYRRKEPRYQIIGIHLYLLSAIEIRLAGRFRQLLIQRHLSAEKDVSAAPPRIT